MIVLVDYATPSLFESTRSENKLGLTANARRPVQFRGRVAKNGFLIRIALRALGEAIWSNDSWIEAGEILDPVVTVHPDRIFFEAFSGDQSVYAALIVDSELFEMEDEVVTGTTNIDFTSWLWGAIGEMRTNRKTTLRIESAGVEVVTSEAGGRFEKKVDLPEPWVRGFLQVQAAMGMPGTRLSVKPVDLISALRFLRFSKAKVSPRALRYEFEPGADARLILEPWEHVVPLPGAEHNYSEKKSTRVWGRRRLKLIEGLLPFADSVDVYLKGRALPSFYAVKLPGMTFLLGMTGWSGSPFTDSGGFDLMAEAAAADNALLGPTMERLKSRFHLSIEELANELGIERSDASQLMVRLCRQGRCMFDVETARYRHRELFEQPADETVYFPPDLRRELADRFIAEQRVIVKQCLPEETTKTTRLKTPKGTTTREITLRDWRIRGSVNDIDSVEVVVNETERIIFGRCNCLHFQEHLMNRGPCEHILALFLASRSQRTDESTSREVQETDQSRHGPSRWEVEDGAGVDENETFDEDD